MKKSEVYETKFSRSIEIFPFDDSYSARIMVSQSVGLMSLTWEPADINWPATGSRSVEDTDLFISALKEASKIAKKWTKERNHEYISH